MTLDELLHQLRAYRLTLITPTEVWPSPWVTPDFQQALRRHKRSLAQKFQTHSVEVCPAVELHRKYYRYVGDGEYVCDMCRQLGRYLHPKQRAS